MKLSLATAALLWGTVMLWGTGGRAQEATRRPGDSRVQPLEDIQGKAKAADLEGIAPATVVSGQEHPVTPNQQGLCQISRDLSPNVKGTTGINENASRSVLLPTPGKKDLGGFPLTRIADLFSQNRPRPYNCRTN